MTTTTELPQRVRALDRRYPLWWDLALALAITAVSLSATPRLDAAGVVLLVVVHGAVVLRRRAPRPALLAAFAGTGLISVLTLATDLRLPWTYLAVWVLLYGYGLRAHGRLVAVATAVVTLTAVSALASPADPGPVELPQRAGTVVAVFGMCSASFLLGLQVRGRREQRAAQRAQIAREAVLAERSRIAQEMHDLVGHNLSVITSLATGGSVAVRTAPEEAARAFDAIGAVSRSSVREVRRILTVLRHDHSADGVPLSPQPGLDDVPALVDSVRSAGVTVHLERTGDLRRLSAGRQLAVYRIVQESLTNALRHAGPGVHVTATIRRDHDELVVVVADGGPAVHHGTPDGARYEDGHGTGHGTGQGLTGMRERAEAYGGTLEAGATGAGWTVTARIPADRSDER